MNRSGTVPTIIFKKQILKCSECWFSLPVPNFLPSWSPALQVQEWEFSQRGAQWVTWRPPAGVVEDMAYQTQSEDRSHSYNSRGKEGGIWWLLCRAFTNDWFHKFRLVQRIINWKDVFFLPDIFQELVKLESRKLWEPGAKTRLLICANCSDQWNQIINSSKK